MSSWLSQISLSHVLCVVAIGATLATIASYICNYLARIRQMELDASLKHDMLERGMPINEIQALLTASSKQPKGWLD